MTGNLYRTFSEGNIQYFTTSFLDIKCSFDEAEERIVTFLAPWDIKELCKPAVKAAMGSTAELEQ